MLSALYPTSFITSNPFRGISYTRTRGRNAHKKRANIRRKSELTKHFALIFKQLRVFSLTHEMLAQRLYQHFTTKKTRFWPPEVQTTRDVHIAHHPIAEPRATTYATPKCDNAEIPCTRFSTQRSTLSHAPKPRSYHLKDDTFLHNEVRNTRSPHSYKAIIAHPTRQHNLTVTPSLKSWHTRHQTIDCLIRPLCEGTLVGTSLRIFFTGVCFRHRRALLLYMGCYSIYII